MSKRGTNDQQHIIDALNKGDYNKSKFKIFCNSKKNIFHVFLF